MQLSRRAFLTGAAAAGAVTALPMPALAARVLQGKEAMYSYLYSGLRVERIAANEHLHPNCRCSVSTIHHTWTVYLSDGQPNGTQGTFSTNDDALMRYMLDMMKRKASMTMAIERPHEDGTRDIDGIQFFEADDEDIDAL